MMIDGDYLDLLTLPSKPKQLGSRSIIGHEFAVMFMTA